MCGADGFLASRSMPANAKKRPNTSLITTAVIKKTKPDAATILHSDHGALMRTGIAAAKLVEIGIDRSSARPRFSNDQAYAESLFRTIKYDQCHALRHCRIL